MRPIHLTSSANPHVKAVLRLHRQRERGRTGRFIAEGPRQVGRALRAGLVMEQLYWSVGLLSPEQSDPASLLQEHPWAVGFSVSTALMEKMAYCQNPHGVLAVFQQPRWDINPACPETSPPDPDHPELWLVAVGTQKPGNLGAMARSALAAGCRGLLVADGVVDAFNPNAVRASTGAVYTLPVIPAPTEVVIAFLQHRRVNILAATPHADRPYTDCDMTAPTALVIGPEAGRLGQPWVGGCGPRQVSAGRGVSIPMLHGAVDSLNAAAAASVLLFEAVRQRRSPPE